MGSLTKSVMLRMRKDPLARVFSPATHVQPGDAAISGWNQEPTQGFHDKTGVNGLIFRR